MQVSSHSQEVNVYILDAYNALPFLSTSPSSAPSSLKQLLFVLTSLVLSVRIETGRSPYICAAAPSCPPSRTIASLSGLCLFSFLPAVFPLLVTVQTPRFPLFLHSPQSFRVFPPLQLQGREAGCSSSHREAFISCPTEGKA